MTNLCKCGCGGAANYGQWVWSHWLKGRVAWNKGISKRANAGLIPCACGCGSLIPAINTDYKPGKFKKGHQSVGPSAYNWKGDNVPYQSLHDWLRKWMPKPKSGLCQQCNVREAEEIANITGIYNRDFQNYNYLCQKCHRVLDQVIDMSSRKCSICKSSDTCLNKYGRPRWGYNNNNELICSKCRSKEYNPKYQASHRERINEKNRIWYAKNKKHCNERQRINYLRRKMPASKSKSTLDAFLCVPAFKEKKKQNASL